MTQLIMGHSVSGYFLTSWILSNMRIPIFMIARNAFLKGLGKHSEYHYNRVRINCMS